MANDALGADSDYQKAEFEIQRAFGRDRHSVSVLLRHGDAFGSELPPFDSFELGGFQNLSGYQDRQILANRLTFGRVVYGYQIGQTGALARGLYVGGSLEAADVRGRLNAIGSENYAGRRLPVHRGRHRDRPLLPGCRAGRRRRTRALPVPRPTLTWRCRVRRDAYPLRVCYRAGAQLASSASGDLARHLDRPLGAWAAAGAVDPPARAGARGTACPAARWPSA